MLDTGLNASEMMVGNNVIIVRQMSGAELREGTMYAVAQLGVRKASRSEHFECLVPVTTTLAEAEQEAYRDCFAKASAWAGSQFVQFLDPAAGL